MEQKDVDSGTVWTAQRDGEQNRVDSRAMERYRPQVKRRMWTDDR